MATFVLIHGGGHRGWHWRYLRPELEALGHQTLAPDVPMDDPRAGAADWAEVVLATLRGLDDPADAVLVGHSLAGLALPLVAARQPVRRMVFLCANLPVPGMSYEAYLAENPEAVIMPPVSFDEQGRLTLSRPDAAALYYGDVDDERATQAWEHLVPSAAMKAFTEPCPLERWPDVAASYVLCTEDRIIGARWARAASRERLGIVAVELPGSHSPMLSRPHALAGVLHELTQLGRATREPVTTCGTAPKVPAEGSVEH